jgi:hypothetical protein
MRKFIVGVCMAAISATGVAVVAMPAGAATPAPAQSKLCKLLTGITINPSSDPTAAGGIENAKKYSKALSKAAKQAKGEIKKTLKTLATYYTAIGKTNTQAIQDQAQAFAQATAKYAQYIVDKCVANSLPSGVTIPSIPGQ